MRKGVLYGFRFPPVHHKQRSMYVYIMLFMFQGNSPISQMVIFHDTKNYSARVTLWKYSCNLFRILNIEILKKKFIERSFTYRDWFIHSSTL